jgi:hypothetical protein
MAVAARIFEETPSSRPPTPPPGFLRLFAAVITRYGSEAFHATELGASIEVGPTAGVFTLTVPAEAFDSASQFAAALCVEIEENFSERYALIVLPVEVED